MSVAIPLAQTSDQPSTTTADRLAAFVVDAPVDGRTLKAATPIVLDTLAVTMAGGAEPGVRALAGTLVPDAGDEAVPSFWGAERYRRDDAALLIGMASHVLDYDDVSVLAMCHPSVPVLSALLAAADRRQTSGRTLLEAFAVGTEVLIRLGQAMGFRHYALGFHATATLGTVGAAAACARLLGLDRRQTGHALAIAASMASGLRANFGSMVKSLHVGIAAANGLKAARLAAGGIEGTADAFDGEGYLHAFSGGQVTVWPEGLDLGAPFAVAEPGFEQKRYPCCYMLHKIIEATLALRRDSGLGLDDVASMSVDMPNGATKPLIHPYPRSGLNALFSAPYAVVAGLTDGRIDLRSFTDEAVVRPGVQERLRDVAVVEDTAPPKQGAEVGAAPVTVTLHPVAGEPVSRSVTALPGSLQDPITPDQARSKWTDCLKRANPGADPGAVDRLFDDGAGLADMPRVDGWLDGLAAAVRRG
ncbi:MmgE/PrpD family protein [Thalassobaculum sp.]|uniref:MmgE/PrpD family protein n=1 Tax=Thalassobaculum sp. TaxID=2022740 RepID=UPI0032EE6C91